MPPTRDLAFISYSRADAAWRDRLRVHLAARVRRGALSVWDDTAIGVGEKWREAIAGALGRARVAVLLVSPDWLASDFVAGTELPALLAVAERGGARVVWVPLRASDWANTAIEQYQAAWDPKRPIASLPEAEQDEALEKVCDAIEEAYRLTGAIGRGSSATGSNDGGASAGSRRIPGKWVVLVGGVLVLLLSAYAITLIQKRAKMGPRPAITDGGATGNLPGGTKNALPGGATGGTVLNFGGTVSDVSGTVQQGQVNVNVQGGNHETMERARSTVRGAVDGGR